MQDNVRAPAARASERYAHELGVVLSIASEQAIP